MITSTRPKVGDTQTVALYGWVEDFTDGADTIRARLFGEMVARTTMVVQQFHSDLFHDAHWLTQHVHGACEFDWLVRHSGTNIGEAARTGVAIGAGRGFVLYRVAITVERGMWSATFTVADAHEYGLTPVPTTPSDTLDVINGGVCGLLTVLGITRDDQTIDDLTHLLAARLEV